MLDTGAYLATLAADSEAFAQLAVEHMTDAVPDCPGWAVTDLVGHLGAVYSWAEMVVNAGGPRPAGHRHRIPADTPPDEVEAWFRQRRQAVLDALESHQPGEPAWTFYPPHSGDVGWWRRRQAHETAIHLHDLQVAAGAEPSRMDPAMAADGVDEILTEFLPHLPGTHLGDGLEGRSLRLDCTDAEGAWTLDFSGPEPAVRRHHDALDHTALGHTALGHTAPDSGADVAVRGPAGALFLWVWNRVGSSAAGLEVSGDSPAAALPGIRI